MTAAAVHGFAVTHSHSCSTPPSEPVYWADQQQSNPVQVEAA
jgi:hypothetical protein